MIKIENADVWGFEHAIRGMRNPMNSWDKSDSEWKLFIQEYPNLSEAEFVIGKNDLGLMKKLIKSGSEHRKFMRQILVSTDIVAPLYFYKEFDQYKIGTTTDSCSTMHKIAAKEFELNDFSHEHLVAGLSTLEYVVDMLNIARNVYLSSKSKENWWQLIQLLPSSYNQRRTWTGSYENLYNMYHQRKNHKLDEWKDFCKWIESLPYAKELIVGETDEQSKET